MSAVLSITGANVENAVGQQRYVRTERSANDYAFKSDIDHIFDIPDTYIGSTDPEDRYEVVLNLETMKLSKIPLSISHGIERLFLEILSNAGDNADFTRRARTDLGSIDVTMNRTTIGIRNGGEAIPVVQREDCGGAWVPRLIFGLLRSSSNYDKNVIRMGCGRNGFGAKLTNIFSNRFLVVVQDGKNGRQYTGQWSQGMKSFDREEVIEYSGPNSVYIEWDLNFPRFCNPQYTISEYPEEAFALFARYTADFSSTCKIPTTFNGKSLDFRSIRSFASLYWSPEVCKSAIIHYQWNTPNNEEPEVLKKMTRIQKEKAIAAGTDPDLIPMVEVCVLDTPDDGVILSYVNGLMTIDGGVHVKEAVKVLSTGLLDEVNASLTRGKGKGKGKGATKSAETKSEEAKAPKLTVKDIEPHLSMIINCRLPDPKYSSQTKTTLTAPKPVITVDESVINAIGKWDLVNRLYAALDAKMYKIIQKTDGKRRRAILSKGEQANDCESADALYCIQYLVEGKSAAAYPKKRIDMTPHGKDRGGYYPLKGKFPNIYKFSALYLAGNTEIQEIKASGGLTEHGDYSPGGEARKNLKYGFFIITTDADDDGKHIAALLMLYYRNSHPSLLQQGMVAYLKIAAVKIFTSSDFKVCTHRFFSTDEHDRFLATLTEKEKKFYKDKTRYYKGLGTCKDSDIQDDLINASVVMILLDESSDNSFQLAFDPKFADERKRWIAKWRDVVQCDDVCIQSINGVVNSLLRQQTVTSYMNRELIDYTMAALFRAIVNMFDQFKDAQRKVVYTALLHWNYGDGKAGPMKLGLFAAQAAVATYYHHGPTSLADTAVRMAQMHVGANNLSIFTQDGQFGTRDEGGGDTADARYCETRLEGWVKFGTSKELVDLVPKRLVEGKEAEPVWIPFIIPLGIINGFNGIATGYSTYSPNHNPIDCIIEIRNRCAARLARAPRPRTVLRPWYRNFTGVIDVRDRAVKEIKFESEATNTTSAFDASQMPSAASTFTQMYGHMAGAAGAAYQTGAHGASIQLPIQPAATTSSKVKLVIDNGEDDQGEFTLPGEIDPENPLGANGFGEGDEASSDAEIEVDGNNVGENERAALLAASRASAKGAVSMITYGKFEITSMNKNGTYNISVTELPIQRWVLHYRKWLDSLIVTKQISDVRNNSSTVNDTVNFTISGWVGTPTYKSLGLVRSYGLSNITTIDNEGYPRRFKTVPDLFDAYFDNLIELFEKVRANRVIAIEEKMIDLQLRAKFIGHVCDKEILIINVDESVSLEAMQRYGIPDAYLDKVHARGFTRTAKAKLEKELEKVRGEVEAVRAQTAESIWCGMLDKLLPELLQRGYRPTVQTQW